MENDLFFFLNQTKTQVDSEACTQSCFVTFNPSQFLNEPPVSCKTPQTCWREVTRHTQRALFLLSYIIGANGTGARSEPAEGSSAESGALKILGMAC